MFHSLEANKRSYEGAKKLLTKAFASTDVSIFNVIKQVSEMKLDYGDEPFEYISKIKMKLLKYLNRIFSSISFGTA